VHNLRLAARVVRTTQGTRARNPHRSFGICFALLLRRQPHITKGIKVIVQDIMTSAPMTVSLQTSIGDALNTLTEEGIRHLPVTRGGEVVGILSDRDLGSLGLSLVSDVETRDGVRARLSQPVASLMSGGVITIEQNAELSEAVELLIEEKLSALPVVEGGTTTLVGIVSYIDLLRAAGPALDSL
jgi:CBS domain-containing protein